jgi:hypothetical protein
MAAILQQNKNFRERLFNQDRSYFNNYTPVQPNFNQGWVSENQFNNPLSGSESLRQTGSGRFSTMPVPNQHYGAGPMKNNFDPSVPAPVDRNYEYSAKTQYHSPVINRINRPLDINQSGGSFLRESFPHSSSFPPVISPTVIKRSPKTLFNLFPNTPQAGGNYAPIRDHGGSNPAVNNWLPGTKIPEPMRIYEYSTGSQIHSKPSDPIRYPPSRVRKYKTQYDDFIPFNQTDKLLNSGQFTHVQNNPLIIKS